MAASVRAYIMEIRAQGEFAHQKEWREIRARKSWLSGRQVPGGMW
jgi:hypothetical protein